MSEIEIKPRRGSAFRHFFLRGLAIILPTVLTIWLLVIAYTFVYDKIAYPINWGVQELVLRLTDGPPVTEKDYAEALQDLSAGQQAELGDRLSALGPDATPLRKQLERKSFLDGDPVTRRLVRRQALERWWSGVAIGSFNILDLIGLIVAVVLIYFVGILLGSYIGRSLYNKGEQLLHRVPLIRSVYPSVKQVTDFFFGSPEQRIQFSNVVAVEYPRKGLWSVGLVTGSTMQTIQDRAGKDCMTVFVPSSPTPFTGYVITVPREDTIDLAITIEEAIKFAVSGGVLVPPKEQIPQDPQHTLPRPKPAQEGGSDSPQSISA